MDEFLDGLVSDLKPVRPRRPGREAALLAALGVAELFAWLWMKQPRPDLLHAMATTPSFWWKLASFGSISALGLATTIASLDPSVSPRRGLAWLLLAVFVYVGVGAIMSVPVSHADLARRLNWREGIYCLTHVVPLSMPAIAGLALVMRRGAPTDPPATALAAGVTAAAWAALVFAFNCNQDDYLYVIVWYTIACALGTGIALLVLPRLARW